MLHRITTAVTQNNSTTHPSSFKVGGLIHSRHDKTRDSLGCLACNSNPPMFAMNLKSTHELNPKSIQIVMVCWFEALGQNYWSYPRCYLLKMRRKRSSWSPVLSREGALLLLSFLVKACLERSRCFSQIFLQKFADKCHRPFAQMSS